MDLVKIRESRDALNVELDAILDKDDATDDDVTRAEAIQNTELPALDRKENLIHARAEAREDAVRAMPTVTTPEITDVVDREAQKPFGSLGEQLMCVRNAAVTHNVDKRLLEARATGMSEGVPSDGGFLVQTDFSTQLLEKVHETGKLVDRCERVTISSEANSTKIPGIDETSRANGSRSGGVRGYWLNEGGTKTASAPKFRQIELTLKKLIGLCYCTDEMLADISVMESLLPRLFASEFGFKVDDALINGTGAGQPLGLLNATALVSVAKETGQAAKTIVAENIEKMYARMDAGSVGNAAWYINQDCWPQLFQLHHAVGTGGIPMFVPAGGLSDAPFGTLLGRPIVPLEQCQTLGTKGDIYFADMSQYIIAEKGGIDAASSIHVSFTTDETAFRFVMRIDGQPIWQSALTPYKSSDTISPYVALAVRS